MKKLIISAIFSGIVTLSAIYGQTMPVEKGLEAITPDVLKAQLGFLASDWTEGRMAGERGEYLSADYIASMLQVFGIKPAGDQNLYIDQTENIWREKVSYFQNFVLHKTLAGDDQIFKVISMDGQSSKTINFTSNVDFTINPTDQGIEIEAPVVFAGYGIINEKLNYSDFKNIDVKGKFILKIWGYPENINQSANRESYTSVTPEMEATLKSLGAIGIIEFKPGVNVVGNPVRKEFMEMSSSESNSVYHKALRGFSLPGKEIPDNLIKIFISAKAADEILKGTNIDLEDYINKAGANQAVIVPSVREKRVYLKTTVHTSQVRVRNIIGKVEGNHPDKIIVLGAHYDHLGIHNGRIWNGADDNGSGTVGVMTIARAVMATGRKPDKTLIFAFWTAEEEGLLGSRYWINNPTCSLNNVVLNVNFDMISRYISNNEPDKVTMTYTKSFPEFREMTVNNLKKYGIDLIVDYQPSDNPPGGSDHRSFVAAGIPVMRFKPGHREQYHTPMDELSTIDWDIMEKIIKISFTNVWELASTNW